MLLALWLLAQLPRAHTPSGHPGTRTVVLPPLPVSISLVVAAAGRETRALVTPKQPHREPRPVVVLRAGDTPQIRWEVRNLDSAAAVRSIVVHFLVHRQEAPGAKIPAEPQKGSAIDSVLGTDLSARGATTGNYNTPLPEPGAYLVEVELLDPQGNRRQYCAVDLRVD